MLSTLYITGKLEYRIDLWDWDYWDLLMKTFFM